MLTKEQITMALTRLGELADKQNESIHLLIVGGAALVLAYDARLSTHDVDVIILSANRKLVRSLAREVATELGLKKKWFSDAARIFVTDRTPDTILLATLGLVVARPTIAHLLAMKLLQRGRSNPPVLRHALGSISCQLVPQTSSLRYVTQAYKESETDGLFAPWCTTGLA